MVISITSLIVQKNTNQNRRAIDSDSYKISKSQMDDRVSAGQLNRLSNTFEEDLKLIM